MLTSGMPSAVLPAKVVVVTRQSNCHLIDETSSDAQVTLQEQLRRLIAALSSWNGQLKTELALQQKLIASLERLEGRLDESSSG